MMAVISADPIAREMPRRARSIDRGDGAAGECIEIGHAPSVACDGTLAT